MRVATSTAEGKIEALTEGGTRVAPTDDVTLRDRAESILFRDPKVPKGTINISAERGILVLRGEVPTPGCATSSDARPRRSRASGASTTCSTCRASRRARSWSPRRRASGQPPRDGRCRGGCARGRDRAPRLGRHRRAALGLNDLELERPGAARHARLRAGQQRTDRNVVDAGDRSGTPNVQAAVVDRRPCPRPRLERAHLSVDLDRRLAPVDPAVRPRERVDVRRGAVVLVHGFDLARCPALERQAGRRGRRGPRVAPRAPASSPGRRAAPASAERSGPRRAPRSSPSA